MHSNVLKWTWALIMGACLSVSSGMAADALSPVAEAPAPTFELDGHALKTAAVVFETGTAKLTPEADVALKHVKAYLDAKTYITQLRIEGHVGEGLGDKAQALSEARAKGVADALVAQGVSCDRLLPVGFGASKPVASNSTPEGRAQNARVMFVNAMLRGRAIGGMPVDGGGRIADGWKCGG